MNWSMQVVWVEIWARDIQHDDKDEAEAQQGPQKDEIR